jgi:hypothetical protein
MQYSVLALSMLAANAAAWRFPYGNGGWWGHHGGIQTEIVTDIVTVTATSSAQPPPATSTIVEAPEPTTVVEEVLPTTLITQIVSTVESSVAAAEPTAPVAGSLTADQQAALDAHNAARAEVGTAALVWDDELTAGAQEYADYLAANQIFEHSGAEGVGENLYMTSPSDSPLLDSANAYISEKDQYTGGPITENNYSHYSKSNVKHL